MNSQTARWALRAASLLLPLFLIACGGGGNDSGSGGGSGGGDNGSGGTPRTADLISCPASQNAVQGAAVTVTCQPVNGASGLTLSWQLVSPAGETIPASNGLSLTFTPQQATTYQLRLTASNGVAGETEDVAVVVQANHPPQVSCPPSVNVTARELAKVTCTVSDPDAGQTLTYQWSLDTGSTPPLVPADNEVRFVPPAAGSYVVQLQVSDGVIGTPVTASTTVQASAPGDWRIMPLGDSITHGNLEHASYRVRLWQKLGTAGLNFDMVGSQNSNSDQNLSTPGDTSDDATIPAGFDPDHEGHWGARADQFLDGGDLGFRGRLQGLSGPDIVLLHLGTNDRIQGQTVETTIDDLRGIVSILRDKNPAVRILLARIIPTSGNTWFALNNAISGLGSELCTTISPVVIVDQQDGFSGAGDTYDGIHPNDSGEEKMAQKWADAILNVTAGTVTCP